MRNDLTTPDGPASYPTGWHAVVDTWLAAGVRTVFGLPDDELTLLAALGDQPIQLVLCRDQRNAVFMATGHAVATGRPAYCVVGRGPAVGNAVAGLVEAATGRVPLVLLATGTDATRFGTGAFQELDQLALVRPVVKWAVRVEDPRLLAGTLEKAALVAAAGAPGPVYVEIPATVGTSPVPRRPSQEPMPTGSLPTAPAAPVVATAPDVPAVLARARRPLLLVGGGLRHRDEGGAVQRLAERLGAGLVVTASGRGAVDERHPLFCGVAGLYAAPAVRELWRHADVVVTLGSRLEETAVDGWDALDPAVQVVQVNIEAADLSPGWPGPKVVADAVVTAAAWADADRPEPDPVWVERVGRARSEALATAQSRGKRLRSGPALSVLDVLDALDGAVPRDRILVQENGLADMWSYFWPYWTCHTRGGSVVPSEQTTLGFGAAAAVGVALAVPDRPVVAFVGDGAFNLFRADLATAANAGVGVLYLVLDNGGYGWLQHQLTENAAEAADRFRFADPAGADPTAAGPGHHERVTRRGDLAAALARGWARCAAGQLAVVEIAVRLDDTPPCLWPADPTHPTEPAEPADLSARTTESGETSS
ncbi:thiamine pyrophosphate-binding protein [Solwaraspora sp. WMMD1047]|uniref:thiamine pyrophosphate-binding protein n=1 Tax=Solwaraspora sp. WMMD1047 TaxID=3016102 RepID=UPI002416E346|nr:thiamine pyrophosphate-binding protein [Solwaraspora sp. WMMD1047]MDG4830823.1 thiamine pyrophosphate-binding protein [Solwaraspora sp. WMMD1047]